MSKVIAAGVFIVNKDNRVLICHSTNHAPNTYSIPKGVVEENESHRKAACRETLEETNIDISKYDSLLPLSPVKYRHGKKTIYPFVLLEVTNTRIDFSSFDIKCNSMVPEELGGFPEVDSFLWASLDDAEKLLHYTQASCIPKIKELLLNG